MSKKILSVKLIKKGEKLEVHYRESGTLTTDCTVTYENQVHPDLVNVIQKLAPHLAVLTGCLQEKQMKDKELVEKFFVTGYSIGGKDDQEGITITGYRSVARGTVTLNSPFLRLEQSENNPYMLLQALINLVDDEIQAEVIEYTDNGKQAQASLEFPEEKVTQMIIAPPAIEDNVTLADIKNMTNRKGKKVEEEEVYELNGIKFADKEEYEHAKAKADKKADKKSGQKKRVPQTAKNKSGIEE